MNHLKKWRHEWMVASRFLPELRPHRLRLMGVALVFLAVIALEIVRPWVLRWVIDDAILGEGITPDAAQEIVLQAALLLLLLLAAKALAEYVATLKLTEIGHAVTRSLRLRVFRHLVELPPDYHAKNKSGDLLVRLLGDVSMLKDMLVDACVHIGVRSLQAVGIVCVMAFVDPILAIAVLAPLPLLAISVRFLSTRLRVAVRKQRKKEGAMANYMHEAIAATPVVQSLGGGQHVVRRFARTNRRNARAGLKTARAAARLSGSVELLLAIAYSTAIGLGGYRVIGGALSPGELILFLSYVRSVLKPVRTATKHQARIAKGTACGERILAVLDEDIELRANENGLLPPTRPRVLTFDKVGHTYPDGTCALSDVSFECRTGEVAALVGPSGAGKSTLVCLAMRLFDPSQGVVCLDGVPLQELDVDRLRDCFAISMQATVLFGESLRENLSLGRPDADEDAMWRALSDASFDDVVRKLPDGLDTVLGSEGAGLSGGEAQRLCLARAFLRKSPILIVDEPFAGLDNESALRVARALRMRARDGIVLVITHQADKLERIDRMIRIRDGFVRQIDRSETQELKL